MLSYLAGSQVITAGDPVPISSLADVMVDCPGCFRVSTFAFVTPEASVGTVGPVMVSSAPRLDCNPTFNPATGLPPVVTVKVRLERVSPFPDSSTSLSDGMIGDVAAMLTLVRVTETGTTPLVPPEPTSVPVAVLPELSIKVTDWLSV